MKEGGAIIIRISCVIIIVSPTKVNVHCDKYTGSDCETVLGLQSCCESMLFACKQIVKTPCLIRLTKVEAKIPQFQFEHKYAACSCKIIIFFSLFLVCLHLTTSKSHVLDGEWALLITQGPKPVQFVKIVCAEFTIYRNVPSKVSFWLNNGLMSQLNFRK